MIKGDAFNRLEVSSTYVSPHDRYVVSLIVGYAEGQVDNVAQACAAVAEMLCGEGSRHCVLWVFDRLTGEMQQMTRAEADMLLRPMPAG